MLHSVPRSADKNVDHLSTVREGIKKFFSRDDKDSKGIVGEEVFRSFLRKSGLQAKLSTAEVRRLLEKLRRRVAIKGSGPRGSAMIDYEKYVLVVMCMYCCNTRVTV